MDPLADWLTTAGASRSRLVRARLATPWGMRLVAAEQIYMHVVVEGRCWLRTAGAEPQPLHEGDFAILPHGHGHELADARVTAAEPREVVLARPTAPIGVPATTLMCGSYSLDEQIAQPMLGALPPAVVFSAARVQATAPLASVLALLTAELESPAPGSGVLVRHLFDTLFLYVIRAWMSEAGDAQPSWLSVLRDVAVAKALAEMHAEPTREWSVDELAHKASLSRAAFARRFGEALGEPPLTYLTRWRMALAAKILVETDASIAEVATRVGYESEFSFSRAFKRTRGQAPRTFRQRRRAMF